MNLQLFAANAQLPEGTDLFEIFKYVSLVLTVDVDSGEILQCSIPVYCQQGNEFISDIMKGKSLEKDVNIIIAEVEERIHMSSKRALITAIQMIQNRYMMTKNKIRAKG
ncbi:DUF3870 domain-containing protein [Sporomusa sp. KB1]|jgi:hypothetical protein|uniref:DUF3870 domain-containing protein n=1 Tax=Sporomusa sp. KB1 TaxID=943346 RepID=UPI0011AAA51F|nr:DUF3870 domain-containing protein [Sporomusa sp. KB1]TWH49213.1 uncharacterized protein DUF3870 [Sporomusa sp. KB1]